MSVAFCRFELLVIRAGDVCEFSRGGLMRMPRLAAWTMLAIGTVGVLRGFGQSNSAKPTAVPMVTYADAAGDVSFEYPVVWKLDNTAKFYLPPHILAGGVLPRAQVVFSPAGNYYAKTTLTALVFAYLKTETPTQAACNAAAIGSVPAQAETVAINGVTFRHFDTGDAGMCHGADQHVYWTYRQSDGQTGGSCYLFEGDMLTSCSGAYPGQRDLTESEKRALNRHLNGIPQSIRFASQ